MSTWQISFEKFGNHAILIQYCGKDVCWDPARQVVYLSPIAILVPAAQIEYVAGLLVF